MAKIAQDPVGHVHIRTTIERKSAWVKAAKPRKLAEWIIEALDAAATASASKRGEPSISPETAPRGGAYNSKLTPEDQVDVEEMSSNPTMSWRLKSLKTVKKSSTRSA